MLRHSALVITPEEHAPVFAQVRTWFKRLSGSLDLDQVVWHYTKGDPVLRMLESGEIFATQASCLNDTTEILYAARGLRKAIEARLLGDQLREDTAAFLKRYSDALVDTPELPIHAGSMYSVSCFSELEDELSQWRGYGGGENGYALGFPVRYLLGGPNSLVGKVNYDTVLHEELATEVAAATVHFYEAVKDNRTSQDLDDFDTEFLQYWDQAISAIAPFVKDPGFASEREVRIARQYTADDLANVVVLQKRTMMSRHLPMRLSAGLVDGVQRLPATRILVGPGRHKRVSQISLDVFLAKHGYRWVKTDTSVRPYQET